ncbi:MAG: inner membrane CreD family protein [Armatimonadetes bacterium]|nr:inner membrane CreD family protein [Armatimonadota bacterium]
MRDDSMCTSVRRLGFRPGFIVIAVGALLLVVALPPAAGMDQYNMMMEEVAAPAGVAAQKARMAQQANMPQRQQPPPPKPAPVTRDKETVRLTVAAKYGDEEDADLRRYEATFEATYVIRNKKDKKTTLVVYFPYPASADTLPDAAVHVNGKDPENVEYTQQGVSWETTFLPEQIKEITVKYRAFGTEDFAYALDHGERIRDLDMSVTVSGTERPPELGQSLLPTTPLTRAHDSFTVEWKYKDLLTSRDICIEIPARLLGSNVANRFPALLRAGVATVVLFGMMLFIGGLVSGKRVAAPQYVLIALALAVFYPMLLYLSEHMRLSQAFGICFVAVGLMVLGSLLRSHGLKFALGYGGLGLVILLGLFSAAALATRGAGALVTIGVLVLVGFAMYTVPRISIARPKPLLPGVVPPHEPGATREEVTPTGDADVADAAGEQMPGPAPPKREPGAFCAFCGAEVAQDFSFCPSCGETARVAEGCVQCGTPICRECGGDYRFFPGCGAPLLRGEATEPPHSE